MSGFGAGAEPLWQSLCAGRRALRPIDGLRRVTGVTLGATVPEEVGLGTGDRAIAMALAAATEAVTHAGGVDSAELGVAVGTTLGGIDAWLGVVRGETRRAERWRWSGLAEALAERFAARRAVLTCSVACASSNAALGAALDLLASGQAGQVVAGGVDALSDFVAAGFSSLKAIDPAGARPFDAERAGLSLGEGACFLVLESDEHARQRGATVHAWLAGYGSAADANHMTGPDRDGRGATNAMAAALDMAGIAREEIDFVSAHGTGTRFNDAMEANALVALLGARAHSVPVNSIKGAIGHTLGAAGAFEALLCVRALETGALPPTAGLERRDPTIALDVWGGEARRAGIRTALSTSSGFAGLNAAVAFRAA